MPNELTPIRLREMRLAANLSQRELAERLKIRPVVVSAWELARLPIEISEEQLWAAIERPAPPRDPAGAGRIALERVRWVEKDTTVVRKHVEGMQRRIREALEALAAMQPSA